MKVQVSPPSGDAKWCKHQKKSQVANRQTGNQWTKIGQVSDLQSSDRWCSSASDPEKQGRKRPSRTQGLKDSGSASAKLQALYAIYASICTVRSLISTWISMNQHESWHPHPSKSECLWVSLLMQLPYSLDRLETWYSVMQLNQKEIRQNLSSCQKSSSNACHVSTYSIIVSIILHLMHGWL